MDGWLLLIFTMNSWNKNNMKTFGICGSWQIQWNHLYKQWSVSKWRARWETENAKATLFILILHFTCTVHFNLCRGFSESVGFYEYTPTKGTQYFPSLKCSIEVPNVSTGMNSWSDFTQWIVHTELKKTVFQSWSPTPLQCCLTCHDLRRYCTQLLTQFNGLKLCTFFFQDGSDIWSGRAVKHMYHGPNIKWICLQNSWGANVVEMLMTKQQTLNESNGNTEY